MHIVSRCWLVRPAMTAWRADIEVALRRRAGQRNASHVAMIPVGFGLWFSLVSSHHDPTRPAGTYQHMHRTSQTPTSQHRSWPSHVVSPRDILDAGGARHAMRRTSEAKQAGTPSFHNCDSHTLDMQRGKG
jgi:hypothetical protein